MLKGISKRLIGAFSTKAKWVFLSVGVVSLAGVGSLGVATSTANAVDLSNPIGSLGGGGLTGLLSSYGGNVSTCAIDTVGWVICPTMRSIAKLADYGFAFINTNFLRLEYNIAGAGSGIFKSWQLMQTIANVLFVLALMVIAYAQITGKGGTYSIKRLLPRLIIAAIAVNLSYFICTIAIEITGIFGDGILNLLKGITQQIGPAAMSLDSARQGFNDSRITDITTAVLNKNGTVWILLAPVAAVAVAVAITCAVGLVILIMRKVVVSMLVLVAPIAFVLYLLPNTEQFFHQWRRLFVQLLLLYPVVAFLLGTGQIISATIMNVGTGDKNSYRVADDSYFPRNGGSGSTMTDLAAAGAAVLPLLGTWFMMKSITSLASTAGSRIAGNIGNRRQNQDEKINAKMKAKEAQQGTKAGLPSYDRGPAFRRRRKAGEGLGALSSSAGGKRTGASGKAGVGDSGGLGGDKPIPSMFDRMTGNINGAGDVSAKDAQADADKKLEEINSAKIADAQAALAGDASLTAAEKEKGKSAKDIFNNMNESHHMKDKDKENGPAQAGAGAPPGQQQGGGTPGQAGPTTEYRAPNIMQNQGVKTSGPATGGVQQVIAVPVQVDAASFINKKPTPGAGGVPAGAGAVDGTVLPPTSEIQKKANERAQRYIFDSTKDSDGDKHKSAEDEQKRMIRDALGHKKREK